MRHDLVGSLFPLLVGVLLTSAAPRANAKDPVVFISAFAAGDHGAIHAYELELKSGTLK